MPLYDIPALLNAFDDLKKVYAAALDGQPLKVKSSNIYQQGEKLFINCEFEGGAIQKAEAQHYLISTEPDTIKIDGKDVDQDDVDLTKVIKLLYFELKYTLEYSAAGASHVLVLRARHKII